jgi:hypothetical protein
MRLVSVCTDYSDDVTGLTIFNPLRDRAPEVAAEHFFVDLREGRLQQSGFKTKQFKVDAYENGIPGFAWKLRNRKYENGKVILFYNFDKYEAGVTSNFDSEGAVEVVKEDWVWKVSDFGVVW